MGDDIPMVLITEVLSKLPVKSLLRFLCVSKSWESLIKDPHFVKLHLKHSLENNTNHALILRDCYLYSLDFPGFNLLNVIDHPLKSPSYGTEIYGSCNGLLCLSNGDEEGIDGTIFYNPATRKHHVLPATPIEFSENSFCAERKVYGFGYDAVNDDYKLVRIIQFDGSGFDEFDSEVKVYSLKSGSWTRINDFPRGYYLSYKRGWGFYVNGCLHWVVTRNPDSDGTKLIVAFDLGSEECKIVPHPECSDEECHMTVGALKGCLCVLHNYPDVKVDVWIMEEYGVENSWTKLLSIANGGIMGLFEYVRPIAFSNDGLRVLVEKDGKRAFWFDLQRQTVEKVVVRGLPLLYDAELIVESLVPLDCHQQKKKKGKAKVKVTKEEPKQKEKKSKQKRGDEMDGFLSKGFKLKL